MTVSALPIDIPDQRTQTRVLGWVMIALTGVPSVALAVHHATTIPGFGPNWIAYIYGALPAIIAALASHMLTLRSRRSTHATVLIRIGSFLVMAGAMAINWNAIRITIAPAAGGLDWAFPLILDVAAMIGLHFVLSGEDTKADTGSGQADTGHGKEADTQPAKRTRKQPAKRTPASGQPDTATAMSAGQAATGVSAVLSAPDNEEDTGTGQEDNGQGKHRTRLSPVPSLEADETPAERTADMTTDALVIRLLEARPDMTQQDMAAELGISVRTVRRKVKAIAEDTAKRTRERPSGQADTGHM